MAVTQWYIKFETLIGGTTPVYFASDALSGFTEDGTTKFRILKTDGLSLTAQSVQMLEGTNTYPTLSFGLIDVKRGYITGDGTTQDTGDATACFFTNKAYIYSSRVTLYEGDSSTAYTAFTKRFSGYVSSLTRVMGGYTIEVQSMFKRLENPVLFPVGSFQVADGFEHNAITPSAVKVKNWTNLGAPFDRVNIIDCDSANWTVTSGSFTFDNGAKTILATNTTVPCTAYRDIIIGTGASQAKYGGCYTFFYYVWPDLATPQPGYASANYMLVQGIDSFGNILSSDRYDFVRNIGVASGNSYGGVMYGVFDPTAYKIRITISVDDSPGYVGPDINRQSKIFSPVFGFSNVWQIGREILDVGTSDASGLTGLVARGGLGTLASYHAADEEALRVTPIGGHPCDIFRRMTLSTSTAGTNGNYDVGDGLGMGGEFSSVDIDSSSIDVVRDYIKTGELYPEYNPETPYTIKQVCSYKGKNYVSLRDENAGNPPDGAQMLSYIDEDEVPVPSDPIPFASSTDNTTTQWRAAWSAAQQEEEATEDVPLVSVTRSSASTIGSSAYWMEIGNYFNGENFRHYKMLFFITQKIENLNEWFVENLWKPIHANCFENSVGQLGVRIMHGIETSGANVLTADHRIFGGEIEQTIDRNYVYNKVVYRLDFDNFATLDIQGNQDGGSSTFAREWQLTEVEMGNESATTTSLAKFGLREYVIESQGARGAHSARFGLSHELFGDQMAHEVARRIITRYGFPVTTYQWHGMFSKRNLDITEVVSVTHANMLDFDNGKWGRTNAPMAILDKEVNYAAGSSDCTFTLRADADVVAITNTTAAAIPVIKPLHMGGSPIPTGSHMYTGFPEISTDATAEIYRNLPIYPKDLSRMITFRITWVTGISYIVGDFVSYNGALYYCILNVTGAFENPSNTTYWTAFDTTFSPLAKVLVYRYTYLPVNGAAIVPVDDQNSNNYRRIQLIGEIEHDDTDFYFLTIGNRNPTYSNITGGGPSYYRHRFQIMNQDREPGPCSLLSGLGTVIGTARNYGRRGGKSEIRQVDSSGQRTTWTGRDGGYTSGGR